MGKNRHWVAAWLMILCPAFLAGCGEYGKVDQGRVIKFDKDKRLVTIIRDVRGDSQNPDYSHLPPVTYELPKNPEDVGADPKAGLMMKLDTRNKEIVIFDPTAGNFKTIRYTLLDQKENVAKDDPLVKDKKFPQVDREKKTITIYSAKQKTLVTFSVPDEFFSLPDNAWDEGDEARFYYKEEGKALRFMNVSKTDIFKK
ncbi:MAG: DUF4881 domain-containing protein [Syntrophobacteraceae bacterium]|nr:DUF4881 domain-containing protein [Syntrophobacteraceae bacterium]